MGAIRKLVDAVLFLYFLFIALVVPLFDAQLCLPRVLFPDFLLNLKDWYCGQYRDYLVAEKPHFFVGLVWVEVLFQWPLALLNVYAIFACKSWFNTTCLIYGVSVFTAMAAILAELRGSEKASDQLLVIYSLFMGAAALAVLRGLVPTSSKSGSAGGRRPALARKKRA